MKSLYVHALWLLVFTLVFTGFLLLGLWVLYDFKSAFLTCNLFMGGLNLVVALYLD